MMASTEQESSFDMLTVKRVCEGYNINCNGKIVPGYPLRYNTPIGEPEFQMIVDCVDWINKNATPRKTTNKNHGSYYLKHVVERACGRYICNGTFIVAAIICGYSSIVWEGPNGYFKMAIQKESLRRGY